MKRRKFLKTLLAFFSTATLVTIAYPAVRFLSPLKKKIESKKLVINRNEIAAGTAKNMIYQNEPIVVVHDLTAGFLAFSRVCTHLGCLVNYNGEEKRFICPCHAANFNLEGNVISGPAPKPLVRYPVLVKGENIVIG